MIERRPPQKRLRLRCRLFGHTWRSALNPKVHECERCNGRWEKAEN